MIHLDSFLFVTGPKTDTWLVKTVSLLIVCMGLTFLKASSAKHFSASVCVLAVSAASAFIFIDMYYPLRGIISKVYMIDGFVQLIFIISWIIIILKRPVVQQPF